jgi:hypothetical protein
MVIVGSALQAAQRAAELAEALRLRLQRGCSVRDWGLWHRLLGRAAAESGRLCHGDGGHGRGERPR